MIYKIKKHSSGIRFGITTKNKIVKEVTFDKSCIYSLNGSDKYDINKLFGVSGSYFHHINSARVGWRCVDNENIELVTYVYEDKKRLKEEIIAKVKPDEKFNISIDIKDDLIYFSFNKKIDMDTIYVNTVKVEKKVKYWKFKYKLFPYFGGDCKAPHKMCIKMT